MRFPLVLACCLAAALAAEEAVKKNDAVKKVEVTARKEEPTKSAEGDKKTPLKEDADDALLPEKTWGESVHALHPTAELFAANLPMYTKSKIKPEIAQAFDLTEELANWNKEGNPNYLTFTGDNGEPTYAVMSSNQPVFLSSYATDVRFHLFTKYNESDIEGFRVTDFKQLEGAGFDATLPVKVVIHGYTNSIKSPAIQLIKNAFLEIGKFNVIGVDWGDLCRGPWYIGSRAHVTGTGAQVGEFLDGLIELGLTEPSMLHLMGHSLGAHVAGIASKSMTKGKPARITGMDPAGPLFQLTNNNGILWRDDADLVDIIHTNAGLLGKSKHLGHVDFFPNGGHFQPGCPLDVTGACSHGRAVELFATTIRDKEAHLRGVLCPALPGHTGPCERTIRDGNPAATAEMGYYVQYDKEGAYFLKTSEKPNFKYVYAL